MTTWRILSWNILGSKDPNLHVIADTLAAFLPDAVALQEVRHHQAVQLARRLHWRATWTRERYPWTPFIWWRAEGLAILTPHVFTDPHAASISPRKSTWTFRHRVFMRATIRRRGDALTLGNTHLASHGVDERIAQARRIHLWLDDHATTFPLVIAGGLNAVDDVELLREFATLGLRDPGGTPTGPADRPHQRLDSVLIPEEATVTQRVTPDGSDEWRMLSDHLPVLVELEL